MADRRVAGERMLPACISPHLAEDIRQFMAAHPPQRFHQPLFPMLRHRLSNLPTPPKPLRAHTSPPAKKIFTPKSAATISPSAIHFPGISPPRFGFYSSHSAWPKSCRLPKCRDLPCIAFRGACGAFPPVFTPAGWSDISLWISYSTA